MANAASESRCKGQIYKEMMLKSDEGIRGGWFDYLVIYLTLDAVEE